MATTVYFSNTAFTAFTPAVDASWTYSNATVGTYAMPTTPDASAQTGLTHTNSTSTSVEFGVRARFLIGPLSAQTISGSIKGQMLCFESVTGNNATLAIAIHRVNSSGTHQDTLLVATASDKTNTTPPEMATTVTNRSFNDAAESATISLTSRTTVDGDYLCVEIGAREVGNALTSENLRIGCVASSGNLPENQTETSTNYRSWLQFSQTLQFVTDLSFTGESIASAEAMGSPTLNLTLSILGISIPSMEFVGIPTVVVEGGIGVPAYLLYTPHAGI